MSDRAWSRRGGTAVASPTGASSAVSGPTGAPAEVLVPAPRRATSGLSDRAERDLTSASTATLSLVRVIAVACGFTWLVYLFSHTLPRLDSDDGTGGHLTSEFVGFAVLVTAASAVMTSALVHTRANYRRVMRAASFAYLVLLAVHVATFVALGHSVLLDLQLGEFVGIPMVLFVSTTRPRTGLPVAFAVTVVAVFFNYSNDLVWNDVIEVSHGVLLALPFYVLTGVSIHNGTRLDALAARSYEESLAVARLSSLREMETRFMAFVHDEVLSALRAIAAGLAPAATSSVDLSAIAESAVETTTESPLDEVVASMVEVVRATAPDTRISATEGIPAGVTLRADAAATLVDALREAALNSRTHAPSASRVCTIDVQLRDREFVGLDIEFTDSGPGFDVASVPSGHAGLLVTIRDRTFRTPGCLATLESSPSSGTRIHLGWSATRRDEETEGTERDVPIPDAYSLIGMHHIFGWYYVPIGLVLALLLMTTAEPFRHGPAAAAWWLVSFAATAVTIVAVRAGAELRLRKVPTAIAACALLASFLAAMLADIPPRLVPWPDYWYQPMFVLLLAALAIRGRGFVALAVLFAAAAAEWFAADSPAEGGASALRIVLAAIFLIPAVLIPFMSRQVTRALPAALAMRRRETVDLAVIATKRDFLADSTAWLQRQIDLLGDTHATMARDEFARVLELRLRDSIRSPGLDTPEITDAVWRARVRGVEVRILDDHFGELDDATSLSPAAARRLRAFFDAMLAELASLAALGEGTLTARLAPPGRPAFGSIVVRTAETDRRIVVPNSSGVAGSAAAAPRTVLVDDGRE